MVRFGGLAVFLAETLQGPAELCGGHTAGWWWSSDLGCSQSTLPGVHTLCLSQRILWSPCSLVSQSLCRRVTRGSGVVLTSPLIAGRTERDTCQGRGARMALGTAVTSLPGVALLP